MAGIGFELRRVISRGGMANAFNAALSGILIVAGPWLLTILTIFSIRLFFDAIHLAHADLFQAVIVYSYALSLSFFSVIHYLFTRMVSDLLWENHQREASFWLIGFCVFTALVAGLLATIPMSFLGLPAIDNPGLFKFGAVLLFVAINLLWLLMLHISLLKWYVQIMLVYVLGMASAVGLVVWWGSHGGLGGALCGFAVGHLLIVAALILMSFVAYPPKKPTTQAMLPLVYLKKYWLLILSGFFFYLGQWADKFFFWLSQGRPIEGSFFKLFEPYDLPVYLAGLSIIPGLVYFVIFSETSFYFALQKFLHALTRHPYARIQQAKYNLIRVMSLAIRDLAVFQALFTLLACVWALSALGDDPSRAITLLCLVAGFFQLMLMTVLNFLYYFELYKQAFVGALAFLILNGVVCPLAYTAWPQATPGLGFLLSATLACVFSWVLLQKAVVTIDRRIFLKALL